MSDTTTRSTPTVMPPGKKPLLRRRWVKVTGAITGGSLITAKQTDGSVKTYAGTDTVANGVIVAAHITQTGGPAA